MPKVHYRKARKDYPDQGIKKGDMYYYTKLRLQRGGIVKRSLTPFKPSQLTNSPFKSAYLAMSEAWYEAGGTGEGIREAADAMQELADNAQDAFDNMPEGLQQGSAGELLEGRANGCEEKVSDLQGLADELEGLDDPEELDDAPFDPSDYAEEMSAMDPEDVGEFLAQQEQDHNDRIEQWRAACDEHATETARILEEVAAILEDMPE